MAESGENDTPAESPGIAMKLTIAGIKQKFSSVKNISTETLSSMMKTVPLASTSVESDGKDKLLLLDSRAEEEYFVGHIPGARRVDYKAETEHLISSIPELLSPEGGVTVVCYCSVGYRSSMVAEKISDYLKLKESGKKQTVKVYNLEGSIFKWANEKRPMVDNKNRSTVYAHPFNAVFGKLLKKELRKTSIDNGPTYRV